MESRYRKTMLRLAILCNVVGAALVVIFVISQQDPRVRKMRPLATLAPAERSAPEASAPPSAVSGTHVYGPFLPPRPDTKSEAEGVKAAPQGKEASEAGGGRAMVSRMPLTRIPPPFPQVTSPMPVVGVPAAASPESDPPSLQVSIPANIFADEQQAAEVATLLGTQLSRQGYLTTVVVTDQQKITSMTTPTDPAAHRTAERPSPPAAGWNVPAGPKPSAEAPPALANPPVTIAQEPSTAGMPQPPLVPEEAPRDAPVPGPERSPAASERVTEAGQEAVKRATEGILEAWRQAGSAGLSVEQEAPAASADRTTVGSVAPEPRAPEASPIGDRNTAAPDRPKTVGPPPAPAATPKASETSSRQPGRERSTAAPGRPASYPIYQVASVYEVWVALLESRSYALQIQQELQQKGFTFYLWDLSLAGQQKYILWAGPYTSRSAAETLERNLNEQGYGTAVRPAISYRPAGRGATGLYAVQIGGRQDAKQARRLRLGLVANGVPAVVDRDPASALARVCVGPFANREEAQQSAEHLHQTGYPTTVVSLD